MTKLNRLTRRIWYFPWEEERDRPNLTYIRGDRWSLAVDAGHSDAHVAAFYRALEDAGLPLPRLTAITHWHWDHTFGMHAVHGLCLANARTNRYLKDFRDRVAREGRQVFLNLDASVRAEYANDKPIIITLADMVFSGELALDAGNCPIRLFEAEAPHTDDSTLIHVPEEDVLILGDSTGGVFPTWERDAALSEKLAQTIESTAANTCVVGHWSPLPTRDILTDLREDE